ncbi:MAG: hypothetical protein HW412_186 [Bacteroidetes bacterium]|nr:hypothetical protein [Bacteroidota bacterium]
MIPHLRSEFNRHFTEEKYQLFLKRLDAICGCHVDFRVSETPVFVPTPLMKMMEQAGKEIITQLVSNAGYQKLAAKTIPPEFNAPNETPRPLFAAVDFGLVKDSDGEIVPKVIEMQGFPSLFCFEPVQCQLFKEVFDLPGELTYLLGGLNLDGYYALLRKAILGGHAPENVVLTELDPDNQKTRSDFILTERLCGIRTVNIRDVIKEGKRLFYMNDRTKTQITRIYNRAIADELVKCGVNLPFSFRDELDVEWAGHPNWFFRMSKFTLPFLKHPTVPKTTFLHEMKSIPADLENYVLKPLYSFAGSGVVVGPTRAEVDAVPESKRSEYILQEKVEYAPVVNAIPGPTKAEVRIMFIWLDELQPAMNLIRMGRGKMMGVDYNKNLTWVGSSAGLCM